MKREYFELNQSDESVTVVMALLILFGPLILFCILATLYNVAGAVIGVLFLVAFWFVIFKINNTKGPVLGRFTKQKRYYFKIPEAHKYVDIEVASASVMDDLYSSGALYYAHGDDLNFMSYMYNLFKDNDILSSERLTVYEISKEDFLSHYSYYEPSFFKFSVIYAFPYSSLGLSKEEFKSRFRHDFKSMSLFSYFNDYADLVDGYESYHGGSTYRYK